MSTFKAIRELLGMTQTALGEAIGCTQGNISFYEKGQRVMPDVAAKLIEAAKARGIELTYDHIYGSADLPAPATPEPATATQGG